MADIGNIEFCLEFFTNIAEKNTNKKQSSIIIFQSKESERSLFSPKQLIRLQSEKKRKSKSDKGLTVDKLKSSEEGGESSDSIQTSDFNSDSEQITDS